MPMTGAERQRRYRQKLREENPEKLLQQKRENLERTKKKYKKACDLTDNQQNLQREKWREHKRKKKFENEVKKTSEELLKKVKQRRYYSKLKMENFNLRSTVSRLVKKTKSMQKKINRLKNKIKELTEKLEMTNKDEQEIQTGHEVNEKNNETPYSKTEKLIKETVPLISTPEKQVVKKILFENLVMKESLQKQYSQAKNNSERNTLKKVVNNEITAKYKMKTNFGVYVGLKGRLRARKRINQYKIKQLKELTAFYERDDNSRATAGKKDYRTLHKTRKQVRYLLETLKDLHKKYKNEGGKLSYTSFNRYKPFYVLSPKLVDRNTCACVKHSNLSFMANKLKQLGLINTNNLTELVSTISCSLNDKNCMYDKCDTCSNKMFEFNLPQRNPTDIVSWNMWVTKQLIYSKKTNANQKNEEKTTKRTVKDEITGSLKTLQETFSNQLRLFKKHYFNIMHQFKMYTNCKNNLTEKEIVLHCDFSENYICKMTEEVQAMHFGASKRQISLHTGVIYAKKEDEPQTISFCTISQNNSHTPGAIWAHLSPVLKFVNEKFPAVKIIHFFTDGPTSQYRQKKNFHMMNTTISQFGFNKATWSFFEAAHGKGAADGIGGATKRNLDRYVTHGYDIPDAKAAYDALVNEKSKINYFLVHDEDIQNETKKLDTVSLIAVPNTMKIHQVLSTPNTEIIKFRELSCFCVGHFGFCECFDLSTHNLKKTKKTNNRDVQAIRSKRLIHKHLQAEDSDTSIDSTITYAESDKSIYEIEQLDSDYIEENDILRTTTEDKTVTRENRLWEIDGGMEIEQLDSDYMGENEVLETMVKDKTVDREDRLWEGEEEMEIEQLDSDYMGENEILRTMEEEKTVNCQDRLWKHDEGMEIEVLVSASENMKENKEPTFLIEDKVRNLKETAKNMKDEQRVTILANIRCTPENQAYSNLQLYGPFAKVDQNFRLFPRPRNEKNIKNIYNDPVPSTSGIKHKQTRDIESKIEEKIYDTKFTLSSTHFQNEHLNNYSKRRQEYQTEDMKRLKQNGKTKEQEIKISTKESVEDQKTNSDVTDKNIEDQMKYNDTLASTNTRLEHKAQTREEDPYIITNKLCKVDKSISDDKIKRNIGDLITYDCNMAFNDTELDQKSKFKWKETETSNTKLTEEQDINNSRALLQKIKTDGCDTYLSNIDVNDTVLVRYYEKKKWIYYIGFVERVVINSLENLYTISFLKTVKKPSLKFTLTKKIDRDIVPAINVIKKVNLKLDSKYYMLCDECDQVYFI